MTALADWIAAQRALEERATKGPWEHGANNRVNPYRGQWIRHSTGDDCFEYLVTGDGRGQHGAFVNEHDAAFIASSRTSLPTALRLVEVLAEAHRRISGMSPCDGPQANESLSAIAACERIVEGK